MNRAMRLGLQSYSLRRMAYERAVKVVASLGLKYVEAFPGHLPPEGGNVVFSKMMEEKYGVKLIAHGVNGMAADEKKLRDLFEFAKAAGIEVLTADPDPDSLKLIDELLDSYGIPVAIHNHGPGHRYGNLKSVLDAIEGHHELLGMCLDTGHMARSGGDIVEVAMKVSGRMYGLHLKDVNAMNVDVILGEGRLDFGGMFRVLKEKGALERCAVVLEYELEPENPTPGISKSLDNLRAILERIGIAHR